MALIEITGLIRHYKMGDNVVKALDGVDLVVEKGEFLCLMGPSGSGKSTLLNMIGGLDSPDAGQIVVNGRDISTLDENDLAAYRQQEIGFVFQTFNLIPTMTALQNVEYPLVFAHTSRSERRLRALELLEQVGLDDRVEHKPTEMSGGQQQRVAVARGLVNRPAILLGDEPTGNLDSKTGEEILNVLFELNQSGQTMILVTHDARVANYASRTVNMLDGRIIDSSHDGKGM
jgi:putative ABC transport system ATP-binding protein